MIRETFPVGPLQCNCTILGDETSPARPSSSIPAPRSTDILARPRPSTSLTVKQILDHPRPHRPHRRRRSNSKPSPGAPILYNQADLPLVSHRWTSRPRFLGVPHRQRRSHPDDNLADGQHASPSTGLACRSHRHPPATREGSICLHLPDHSLLLAGDTLFAGSVGRTDLPGGNIAKLLRSIHNTLLPLPDQTRVLPGHGPSTTIGQERATNPFLQRL